MMFSPCCGRVMTNSKKPYDKIGIYNYIHKEGYNSSMEVWKCPECKLCWAIERMMENKEDGWR